MIRSWNYSPPVILRKLHDESYVSELTSSAKAQKEIMEEFVNEVYKKYPAV